jgi:hypothetical protein
VRTELVERVEWDQADLAWHGLFYVLLLFPAVLMTITGPVTDRWPLMWGLVVATMTWHAGLTLPAHKPGSTCRCGVAYSP